MKPVSLLAISLSLWMLSSAPASDKLDPAAIRAKYAKLSADPIAVAERVRVAKIHYWKDGGSIGIELIDAKDAKHLFCLDGRRAPTKDHPDEPGTNSLFQGAVHPSRPGAKRLAVLGPEESALYGVLLRWAEKHSQRDALFNSKIDLNLPEFGDLWETREFFLRLDRRFTGQ